MTYTKTTKTTKTVEITPCVKCGGIDLSIWQDRKYDSATVTCKKCGHDARGSISWDCQDAEVVEKVWNLANDKEKVIAALSAKIEALKEEIKEIRRPKKTF